MYIPPYDWKTSAIYIVDAEFQDPVVERVQKLLDLGYKIGYSTWPPLKNSTVGIPLPSTHVYLGDYGGDKLYECYGLPSSLELLDRTIEALTPKIKVCGCNSQDLFWQGCRC